jgi:hypothetical protein
MTTDTLTLTPADDCGAAIDLGPDCIIDEGDDAIDLPEDCVVEDVIDLPDECVVA